MKYIKKQDIVAILTKLRDAREKKRNCSKQSATEYSIYDYVLKIVDTLETVEKDWVLQREPLGFSAKEGIVSRSLYRPIP